MYSFILVPVNYSFGPASIAGTIVLAIVCILVAAMLLIAAVYGIKDVIDGHRERVAREARFILMAAETAARREEVRSRKR